MQLAIMGLPGAGKTTVGQKVAKNHTVPYISSGAIARKLADADPTTALALKSGSMAPEESMRALIKDELLRALAGSGGFVVEGFPRTIAQYLAMRLWGLIPVFITLEISDAESLERLIRRSRDDDIPDAIAKRLNIFHTETKPLLDILANTGSHWQVDASASQESVIHEVEQIVATYL